MELTDNLKPFFNDGTINDRNAQKIAAVINQPNAILDIIGRLSLSELIAAYDELDRIVTSKGTLILIEQEIRRYGYRANPSYIKASDDDTEIEIFLSARLSGIEHNDRYTVSSKCKQEVETSSYYISEIGKLPNGFNITEYDNTQLQIRYNKYGNVHYVTYLGNDYHVISHN